MVAGRASVAGCDAAFAGGAGSPAESFWNFARGLIRDLERRMTIRPEGENSDDPEKLARAYSTEQVAGLRRPRRQPPCDAGRRAARARLRPDARQCVAPHPAVFAAGRRRAVGAYRRRAARVLLDRGR